MKPTYFGAHVRIDKRGFGLDGQRVVQRENLVGGGWIDVRAFHESDDYCYTDSRFFASNLAAKILLERSSLAEHSGRG